MRRVFRTWSILRSPGNCWTATQITDWFPTPSARWTLWFSLWHTTWSPSTWRNGKITKLTNILRTPWFWKGSALKRSMRLYLCCILLSTSLTWQNSAANSYLCSLWTCSEVSRWSASFPCYSTSYNDRAKKRRRKTRLACLKNRRSWRRTSDNSRRPRPGRTGRIWNFQRLPRDERDEDK